MTWTGTAALYPLRCPACNGLSGGRSAASTARRPWPLGRRATAGRRHRAPADHHGQLAFPVDLVAPGGQLLVEQIDELIRLLPLPAPGQARLDLDLSNWREVGREHVEQGPKDDADFTVRVLERS